MTPNSSHSQSVNFSSEVQRVACTQASETVPQQSQHESVEHTQVQLAWTSKRWRTVSQIVAAHPAFSEGSVRALIHASKPRIRARGKNGDDTIPANGLAQAIRKVGRRVLIDEAEFLSWVNSRANS